jgi:peptide/nickel transport system permease protein/oligopeptide transport system permease protein
MNKRPALRIHEDIAPEITDGAPRISEFRRFCKVFLGRGIVIFGMAVLLAFIIIAIFAPLFAPYDPYEPILGQGLLGPSKEHLLGTDALGRDTLSRIIYGSRTSLIIGLIVVFSAAVIGVSLGLVAGYYGGRVNTIIMRLIDALMAFPMILLALVIAAILGGGIKNVIIALTVGLVPVYTRLMCGQVITGKENDFIMAERALGAGHLRIMVRHLIPNCFPPLIVLMTMMLGATILAEAGLSFLGIGVEAPMAAWGSMVNDGRDYLLRAPILSFAPGFTLMLVVFSFNMVGDGLRDALDPRLRGVLF